MKKKDTILVKIIVPSNIVTQTKANMVNIPGVEGVFGVLPGHAKFITNINIGNINIFTPEGEKKYFVYGGVVQVEDGEVNIVTDFAIFINDVNKNKILNKINDLRSILGDYSIDSVDANIITTKITKFETLLKYIE